MSAAATTTSLTPTPTPTPTPARTQRTAPGSGVTFQMTPGSEASEPPEARGLDRDQVRLLVGWRQRRGLAHTVFRHLPDYLAPGDLLVVNNSATLPAALPAIGPDGTDLELHLSTQLHPDRWVVEPRLAPSAVHLPSGSAAHLPSGSAVDLPSGSAADLPSGSAADLPSGFPARLTSPASAPYTRGMPGMVITLPAGATAELLAPSGTPGRLWVAALQWGRPVAEYLARFGRPIRYGYVPRDWPLDYYQTVFAQVPGSAEMPSAARPFSAALVTELVSRGIGVAPITLHCSVSSLEAHEAPPAERFEVPAATADLVNRTRQRGGRVVAVGTTAVRALESATDPTGIVQPDKGWTDLVITPERGVRAVDGMITGWHEPQASHLALLEAVAGTDLLARSYQAAEACGYRWHEFGDSHLILP